MNQDYKDLLSAFHAHGVKYLIVGGYAVILHTQPRFTKDIDFLIRPDPANARATYAALAEFGAALQGIRPEDFTERDSFFRFGRDPRGTDILPDIPGVDFDAAWEKRVGGEFHFSGRAHSGQTGSRATTGHRGCGSHPQSGGKPSVAPCKESPRNRTALTSEPPLVEFCTMPNLT